MDLVGLAGEGLLIEYDGYLDAISLDRERFGLRWELDVYFVFLLFSSCFELERSMSEETT